MPTDAEPDASTRPETNAAPLSAVDHRPISGLIVLWAPGDRGLLGAWLPAPDEPRVLGRGDALESDPYPRIRPTRQVPGANTLLAPFASPALSRVQLELHPEPGGRIRLKNVGRCNLWLNGSSVNEAGVAPGDLVQIGNQLLLLCCQRPSRLPGDALAAHAFGEADEHGFVGEAPAMWQLRRDLAFVARRPGHVLIHGESGTGKELAATGVHRASKRSGPLVSRNAATFPETLIDAELFGNAKGYPNPGMPERAGLIGAAHGGTLFLDEFAELPVAQQTRLLRVLDAGEYQRLGESAVRRADVRVVAATNRALTDLRHDVAARFAFTVRTPSLASRVEDIPLLVRHLLKAMTRDDDELRARFFPGGEPSVSPELLSLLVRGHAAENVRHLKNTLWRALASSKGDSLLPPGSEPATRAAEARAAPAEDEPEKIRRALARNGGSLDGTWRELGLSSRFALNRLMKKHGIVLRRSTS